MICSAKLGPNRLNEVGRSKAVGRGWLYIFGTPLSCNDDLNPSGRYLSQPVNICGDPELRKNVEAARVAAILFLWLRKVSIIAASKFL